MWQQAGRGNLCNKEFHNLYSSSGIIKVFSIKDNMGRACSMHGRRWELGMKKIWLEILKWWDLSTDGSIILRDALKKIGCSGLEWILVAQDRGQVVMELVVWYFWQSLQCDLTELTGPSGLLASIQTVYLLTMRDCLLWSKSYSHVLFYTIPLCWCLTIYPECI
jgi:hypothetical protein